MNTKINFAGIEMKNPVTVASGTFGYGREYDEIYPGYGFKKNKGYPTKEHMNALDELGITPIHRKSFGPVRDAYIKIKLF